MYKMMDKMSAYKCVLTPLYMWGRMTTKVERLKEEGRLISGEEREDEHEGDPAWRRLSRRTSAGTLRRPYKKETSTEARSGGWGRA